MKIVIGLTIIGANIWFLMHTHIRELSDAIVPAVVVFVSGFICYVLAKSA